MEINKSETRRYSNRTFSLYLVDEIDTVHTIAIKRGFWSNSETYRKSVFTDGNLAKEAVNKTENTINVKFKVFNANWLIIVDENGEISMYVKEQYHLEWKYEQEKQEELYKKAHQGEQQLAYEWEVPVHVRNKYVQEIIENCYIDCSMRIDKKDTFGKEAGVIARRLNMRYTVVLAFKNEEERLSIVKRKIQQAIADRLYENEYFMNSLISENKKVRRESLDIFETGKFKKEHSEVRAAKYIYDCLKAQRVLGKDE